MTTKARGSTLCMFTPGTPVGCARRLWPFVMTHEVIYTSVLNEYSAASASLPSNRCSGLLEAQLNLRYEYLVRGRSPVWC